MRGGRKELVFFILHYKVQAAEGGTAREMFKS